jgi:hypothetical protein
MKPASSKPSPSSSDNSRASGPTTSARVAGGPYIGGQWVPTSMVILRGCSESKHHFGASVVRSLPYSMTLPVYESMRHRR